MKANLKLKVFALLLICSIALVAIFVTGCDGFLSATGTVYEWVDAPQGFMGDVYVDVENPPDRITKPLPEARVYLYRYQPVTTNNTGSFFMKTMVAPGHYMMDIKVEKEGYITLEGKFQHNGSGTLSRHNIIIFLARR